MARPVPVYNRSVILQSPGGAKDASTGERITTWTNEFTEWADISPLSARELLAAGQFQGETTHRVKLRYSATTAAITSAWRVLYGSRVLVIVGPPRNIDEADRELELLCSEGVREE